MTMLEQVTSTSSAATAHSRAPRLARRLFPGVSSSDSNSDQSSGAGGDDGQGQDCSAPIARLESLDELETSQVRTRTILRTQHLEGH